MLLTVGGMSGSGKTTLAAAIAENIKNTVHLDSDRARKKLFGVSATTRLPSEAYTHESTEKLISEMDARMKKYLAEGKNVIISATFIPDSTKEREEQLAADSNAHFIGLWLQTDLEELIKRVGQRINDASDAGAKIVKSQAKENSAGTWSVIDAGQTPQNVLKDALEIIRNKSPRTPE